jgi:hypothetical protein
VSVVAVVVGVDPVDLSLKYTADNATKMTVGGRGGEERREREEGCDHDNGEEEEEVEVEKQHTDERATAT